MNTVRKARVKATGHLVEVYKLNKPGLWCNYQDCTTNYKESELEFID